jgi:hypothetical protein
MRPALIDLAGRQQHLGGGGTFAHIRWAPSYYTWLAEWRHNGLASGDDFAPLKQDIKMFFPLCHTSYKLFHAMPFKPHSFLGECK